MSDAEGLKGPKLLTGDLATIKKRTPRTLEAALKEACTDSDEYTMHFPPSGAGLAPQQKAMMLASLVQIDYMFFEQVRARARGGGGVGLRPPRASAPAPRARAARPSARAHGSPAPAPPRARGDRTTA